MKTASVMSSLSRNSGGLFESVRRLHQCLAEIPGVSVVVLGLRDEFTVADRPAWHPILVMDFAMRWPQQLGYAPGLKQAMLGLDEEIIHTHGIWRYPSMVTNFWHRKTGRPYLVSPHGMLDAWAIQNSAWKKKPAWWLYEHEHLANAACLRALCAAEAQAMRAIGLKNPICIIPNGVDLPVINNQQSAIGSCEAVFGPMASGKKVLLYLGRIHPKKGLVNLLKAWSQIQNPEEWVLAIAGWNQNGHETELKSLATELALPWTDLRAAPSASPLHRGREAGQGEVSNRPSVLFLGPQFNGAKSACYQHCDAFILPSVSEGLPMVILEAWAYGKPVLMTPECNLPEGFAANAAIRIEPGMESIAQGLSSLLRTPHSALHTLGENGRQLVSAKFTWPKIAGDMKSVYDWVLGGGAKPACVWIN